MNKTELTGSSVSDTSQDARTVNYASVDQTVNGESSCENLECSRCLLWVSTFQAPTAMITLVGMKLLVFLGFLVLGILSFRGVRWAYITFVVLGLLYFPASVGFRINPKPCELMPSLALAVFSLTNYGHVVLFAFFFLMTSAQFRISRWSGYAWAALACLVMGLLIELSEGISGAHHCRMRDLVPDAAGTMIGACLLLLWQTVRRYRQST